MPRAPVIPPNITLLAGIAIGFGVASGIDLQVVILVVVAAALYGWSK